MKRCKILSPSCHQKFSHQPGKRKKQKERPMSLKVGRKKKRSCKKYEFVGHSYYNHEEIVARV